MIGKKINQLATELAPVSTDLTIIGNPTTGVSKKITLAQLGAIFSGAVSFYNDLASFPATGDINIIYCAKDTKKLYLWSGSAYVEVFPSQALLDTYQLRSEKGVSNGYASLDSGGKVPISQLPSSIMEYKGMWNAATNTPTLANGTGDTGDVYICNVAGTVDFGAGPLTFAVGDYVIYSGTIWQRSSGAVGTVTSVAATITGDAIGITGSPVTTSGTLALAFSGTSSQYINGAGNLINFPTSLVTGTGTIYSLTKWGFTSGNIINSNLFDTGSVIYNNNATAGSFAVQFNGNTTSGMSYGLLINAGSDANDIALRIQNVSSTSEYFFVYGDGKVKMNNIPNATTDTDTFLVSDGGFIKYRTGAQLLSDIGGASASGYVPYTGATTNLDLGTHTLSAYNLIINHTSGSGVAASITKGGNGEALTVVKSSGSGNAASITGGVTLLDELHLTTDLADAYIASATNWNTAYNSRIVSVVAPLTFSLNTLGITQATGSSNGYLSSADWTTFNNKQNALTNPVTGTGTTNYLPKFTGTSTIGDSNLINDASGNLGLGVTPSAWQSGTKALQINGGSMYASNTYTFISSNAVYTDAGDKYINTGFATIYGQLSGEHRWYNAPSGTAGNAISFTQAMTLDASGRLGIGTSSPTSRLHIYTSSADIFNTLETTGGFSAYNRNKNGNRSWVTGVDGTSSSYIVFDENAGAVRMAITTAGNVGIGTTSPSWLLQVEKNSSGTSGGSYPALSINNPNAAGYSAMYLFYGSTNAGGLEYSNANSNLTVNSAGGMIFSTNAYTERMRITSGGNVGIGTSSPAQKLDVNGSIRLNSLIPASGNTLNIAANSTNYQILSYPFTGLVVVRDNTTGGSGLYLLDPNLGVNAYSNTLPYTLTFTYGSGVWNVQKNTGSSANISFNLIAGV